MNNKVYKTLEYYKIINMLEEQTTSEAGRRIAHKLTPIHNPEKIELMQCETKDALERILKYGSLSFQGVININKYTSRLESEGSLNAEELLLIASFISCGINAIKYNNSKSNDASSDSLDPYFESLSAMSDVHKEITRCIISEQEIASNASPKLSDIRRKKASTSEKIRTTMNKQLNALSEYLQDQVITSRGGRYCLSVRSEFKSRVPGMVHDQSSTGSTFFIEPMQAVDLNNELRELQVREQDEIARILANISNRIAESSEGIIRNFELLTEIDFILAKGRFAIELNASNPEFNEDGIINLRGARHPLLDPKKVVATDIKLGEDYNLLLVTGPNTGGKTVSLKTCGLLTLMAQAGLHIPAKDRSQIAVFDDVENPTNMGSMFRSAAALGIEAVILTSASALVEVLF